MSGSDADISGATKKSRTGIAVGGFATFDLADKLKLRPEIFYIQKGASYEGSGSKSEFNLSYIDVPVLVEFTVMPGDVPVNVFGGVNVAFLLSAENKSTFLGNETTTDGKSDTKALDFGLQFGVGTVINKKFTVDGRYNMGLTSVDDASPKADIKNSGFLITAGYLF